MDHQPMLPEKKKRGRPKGSKDKPRQPGDKPRGRPKKVPEPTQTAQAGVTAVVNDGELADDEYAGVFEDDDITEDMLLDLYNIEMGLQSAAAPSLTESVIPSHVGNKPSEPTRRHLEDASRLSNIRLFFTQRDTFEVEDDSEDDVDSQNEEDVDIPKGERAIAPGAKPWFKQPNYMPNWLYRYFGETIKPLITTKDGKRLMRPPSFTEDKPHAPTTMWIHPPDAVFHLSRGNQLDPTILYRPRVFLWLPHFFVTKLCCPRCKTGILEKNGALSPRRIIDIHDNFYIVSWAYYCRDGCKSHFAGWNTELLGSLPAYLRLAFPAILSHKGGLSRNVMTQLRVGNQHKMGPRGVRSLLIEMHTLRFNTLQLQYLETVFERLSGQELGETNQATIHSYLSSMIPDFGDFGDLHRYAGFIPSEHYLSEMMNKSIERDEGDANQHTACLAVDQIAIDDSHKVNKHIAKIDGVPIFGALWTCMDSRYIRAQALTLTKSHEERLGPLMAISKSLELYGYPNPPIAFSDDPIKDKALLHTAFPSLAEKLTPMAEAYGLKELKLPDSLRIIVLNSPTLVEGVLSSLLSSLDSDKSTVLSVSLDAEWNISRRTGVSIIQIAPHSQPDEIYIIPVHKFGGQLPQSLLRLLISDQVFKIGSSIKADFTRLKKQFSQLEKQRSFNVIDLKEYCTRRGIIPRKGSGALDTLLEKTAGMYLSKDENLRKSEDWETQEICTDLLQYAALDVYASHIVFERATKIAPPATVTVDADTTAPGTRIVLLLQEGGAPVAYGKIADMQPTSLGRVRVKVPTKSRLVVDIDHLLIPSASAILHLLPGEKCGKSKAGTFTLGQLRDMSGSQTFQVVASVSHLNLDIESRNFSSELMGNQEIPKLSTTSNQSDFQLETTSSVRDCDLIESDSDVSSDAEDDSNMLKMFEAYSSVNSKQKGKCRVVDDNADHEMGLEHDVESPVLLKLKDIIESPPDGQEEYTRIKKDIFHAFHMLPIPVNHGSRPAFLRALRDHLMRWDPVVKLEVDKVCRKHFDLTFDQMLRRNPRFIAERTPRHIPSPSVLVIAIQHVYNMFRDAMDVKTGLPLFTESVRIKAEAVLELARQGYLSDIDGVPMYEKAGIDSYGLQWKCIRGTNNVEGGPHGDIYRKFGALHAGPRLTTNCLTDHRTWYNLQASAKHLFGVDWDYHHNLGYINRTSFLLNYLSDVIQGAKSYSDWINGDLYEQTKEEFGICSFPDSLRRRLVMEPYGAAAAAQYPLNDADNWLRKRQGLALPVLPPTTPEARRYFFSKIREFSEEASADKKKMVNFEAFAQEWNRTADGEQRFYVTIEVLSSYAKSWEKMSNVRASQELISEQMQSLVRSSQIFLATQQAFPSSITSNPTQAQPSRGVLDLHSSSVIPASLSTALPLSQTPYPGLLLGMLPPQSYIKMQLLGGTDTYGIDGPKPGSSAAAKRRRVIPEEQRKRQAIRTCRRCGEVTCPGNSNILNCPWPCRVSCKTCGNTEGCRGVDNGRTCTFNS